LVLDELDPALVFARQVAMQDRSDDGSTWVGSGRWPGSGWSMAWPLPLLASGKSPASRAISTASRACSGSPTPLVVQEIVTVQTRGRWLVTSSEFPGRRKLTRKPLPQGAPWAPERCPFPTQFVEGLSALGVRREISLPGNESRLDSAMREPPGVCTRVVFRLLRLGSFCETPAGFISTGDVRFYYYNINHFDATVKRKLGLSNYFLR